MHSVATLDNTVNELVAVVIEENQNVLEETQFFQNKNIPLRFVSLTDLENNLSEYTEMNLLVDKEKLSLSGRKTLNELSYSAPLYFIQYSFDFRNMSHDANADDFTIHLPLDAKPFYQMLKLKKSVLIQKAICKKLESHIEANSRLVSLGELTGSIVHDLNNYMTVCMASYSGVHSALDKNLGEQKIRKFTQLGKKAVDEIVKLTVRCDSFIKGDEVEIQETFQLFEVCSWVGELLSDQFKASRIRLDIKVNKSVNLSTDRGVILQSLLNLVKNSVAAVKTQGGDQWVEIEFVNKLDCAEIIVRDSGSISHDLLNKAFELNFTTNSETGHGVGLYLVRKKLAGIDISIIARNPGQTEFVLSVPRSIITFGM